MSERSRGRAADLAWMKQVSNETTKSRKIKQEIESHSKQEKDTILIALNDIYIKIGSKSPSEIYLAVNKDKIKFSIIASQVLKALKRIKHALLFANADEKKLELLYGKLPAFAKKEIKGKKVIDHIKLNFTTIKNQLEKYIDYWQTNYTHKTLTSQPFLSGFKKTGVRKKIMSFLDKDQELNFEMLRCIRYIYKKEQKLAKSH